MGEAQGDLSTLLSFVTKSDSSHSISRVFYCTTFARFLYTVTALQLCIRGIAMSICLSVCQMREL